jgi:hypothetical protein
MRRPIIHYDRALGMHERWAEVLTKALRGDRRELDQEVNFQKVVSASGPLVLSAMYEYAANGQQTFCIGPQMQSLLTDTDCTGVPEQFVQMPFPCLYIATPDTSHQIYGDKHTGMHNLAGAYMWQRHPDEILFVLWADDNENARQAGDDATFWFSLALKDVPRKTMEDGTVLLDFDKYFKVSLQDSSRDNSDWYVQSEEDEYQLALSQIPNTLRMCINLLLYLTSLKADKQADDEERRRRRTIQRRLNKDMGRIKNPAKRRKRRKSLEREMQNLTSAVIVWLGKKLETSPVPTERSTAGRRASKWHVRRGHWHRFWTGKRKDAEGNWRTDPFGSRIYGDELVLKWVAPVYRDMGDLVQARSRQYRFREEKEDWASK